MAKGTGFAEDIPVKLDPLPFATNPEMSHTVTTQGFRSILFWAKLVGEADQRGPARKHTALVLAHPTPRPQNEFSRASRQSGTCPLQTQGKRRNTAAVTEAAQALTKEHQERDQTVRSLNDAEPCCKNLLRHVRSEQMGVSGHLHANRNQRRTGHMRNHTTNKARHRQLDEGGVSVTCGLSQRRPPCPLTSGLQHARRRGVRR